MPRITTNKEAEKLRKEQLALNAKKWKIIKRILREEVKKYKKSYAIFNLKPPQKILQPHLWILYTNKDHSKPIPKLRSFGKDLGRKISDKFEESGLFDDSISLHVETPEERDLYKEISSMRELPAKRGKMKLGIKTRLPGLIAAIEKFRERSTKKSKGNFIQFLSKKEYTSKTPYEIDRYELYVDDNLIYHRDKLRKDRRGNINPRWDRPIKIKSLDRYYYQYTK